MPEKQDLALQNPVFLYTRDFLLCGKYVIPITKQKNRVMIIRFLRWLFAMYPGVNPQKILDWLDGDNLSVEQTEHYNPNINEWRIESPLKSILYGKNTSGGIEVLVCSWVRHMPTKYVFRKGKLQFIEHTSGRKFSNSQTYDRNHAQLALEQIKNLIQASSVNTN